MVGWSNFSSTISALAVYRNILQSPVLKNGLKMQLRGMSGHEHHVMQIKPSRFQWQKFKSLFHYYAMLGIIPCVAVVIGTNLFIGPAQLSPIPEDYEPKYWEYHRHPITRFIARYMQSSPQQEYEKRLHHLYEEQDQLLIRNLETKINEKMSEREDYQSYYYRPVIAKYHRISKEAAEHVASVAGDN